MATLSPISKARELAPSNPIEEGTQSGKGPVSGSLAGFQEPRLRIPKPAESAKAAKTILEPARDTNNLSSYRQAVVAAAAAALRITQPQVVEPPSGSGPTKAELVSAALKSK